jgi:hypothetical protein
MDYITNYHDVFTDIRRTGGDKREHYIIDDKNILWKMTISIDQIAEKNKKEIETHC